MRFDHCKFLAPTLESMRITAWNADGCALIFKDCEVEHRGKCHPCDLYPGNAEGPLGNLHFSNVTVKDSDSEGGDSDKEKDKEKKDNEGKTLKKVL